MTVYTDHVEGLKAGRIRFYLLAGDGYHNYQMIAENHAVVRSALDESTNIEWKKGDVHPIFGYTQHFGKSLGYAREGDSFCRKEETTDLYGCVDRVVEVDVRGITDEDAQLTGYKTRADFLNSSWLPVFDAYAKQNNLDLWNRPNEYYRAIQVDVVVVEETKSDET